MNRVEGRRGDGRRGEERRGEKRRGEERRREERRGREREEEEQEEKEKRTVRIREPLSEGRKLLISMVLEQFVGRGMNSAPRPGSKLCMRYVSHIYIYIYILLKYQI